MSMSKIRNWEVGQSVQLNDGRTAIVRFVGKLHFTTGDWVGVEFEDASGKNDGSAKGERYFHCAQGHGMFLRPAMIARSMDQQPQPALGLGGVTNAQLAQGRPLSGTSSSTPSRVSKILILIPALKYIHANNLWYSFS